MAASTPEKKLFDAARAASVHYTFFSSHAGFTREGNNGIRFLFEKYEDD